MAAQPEDPTPVRVDQRDDNTWEDYRHALTKHEHLTEQLRQSIALQRAS